MSFDLDRRSAMLVGLAASAAVLSQGCAAAQNVTAATAPASGAPKPMPLPFDPKAITGFSEKILVSHHDNNYVGAVNRIGAIRGELAKLDIATAPGFMTNGLKREELLATNSMILHEVYFGCLGKGGAQPGARLGAQMKRISAATPNGAPSSPPWARRLAADQAGSSSPGRPASGS